MTRCAEPRERFTADACPRATSDVLSFRDHRCELVVFGIVHRVGVVVVGKRALFDFLDVFPDAVDGDFGQLGEALGEFRLEVGEHAEQVVAEQNLAVGSDACADADCRDRQLLGDQFRDLGRHGFEFQHEAAGILDGERVLENLHRGVGRAALDLEAAEHRDGVRRQADVRSGRDAGIDQRLENMRLRLAALRLDRVAQGLLHEARGIGERAIDVW